MQCNCNNYNTLWKGRYVTLLFKKAYRHMRTGCFIRRCNELRHICFPLFLSELRVLLIRYSECRTMIQVKRSVRYLCCPIPPYILRCSGESNGYLNLLKRNNIRRNSIKTVPPFLYIICKRKTALIMIIKAVGTPRGIRTLITPKVFLCYQQYEP